MNRGSIRRHIAFLLALVLIWNVFADNIVKVQAQGSIPGSQSGFQVRTFEINLVDGDNRTPITDESEVHAGQEVEVKFEWTLDNSVRVPDGEPWTPQTFSIDTNSGDFKYAGLNIPGMEAGTSTSPLPLYANGKEAPVGSYYMENGIIYIIIEDQEFFQNEDGRYGGVSFRGTIAASDDKKDDGKKKKIEFGNESANPTYFLTDTESSASLNKTTNGGITAREGKFYQTFTVTVKAQNGTITGLDLQDSVYPEGKLTNATGVKVSASTAEEVPVQNFGSLAEAFTAIKNATLYMDETITLEYTMEVNPDIYKQDAEYYRNRISGTYVSNRSDTPKTLPPKEAYLSVNKPSIQKTGTSYEKRDGKGYVTWTITIDLGDYYTGSENDLAQYLDAITDLPGQGLKERGVNQPLNPGDFVQNPGNPRIFTYTFETEVDESIVDSTADETVKNKVTMTTKDGNTYESGEAGYTIPGKGPSVRKTIQDMVRDDDGLHVTWNICISNIPRANISRLTLQEDARHWNNNPGNQELLKEVYIDGVLVVDSNGNILDTAKIAGIESWSGTAYGSIVFQDAYVAGVASAGGSINVTVKTLITEDTIGHEYGNGAKVSYQDANTGSPTTTPESRATFRDTSNLLTKEGSVVTDKDAIDYKIKVILPPLNIQEAGRHFIIEDILPAGMKLSAAGAKVTVEDQWGNLRGEIDFALSTSQVPVAGTEENATKLSFDVEAKQAWISKIKGYPNGTGDVYYMVLTYRAELTDRAAFLKEGVEKSFTNRVSATYDGNSIGGDSTTNVLTPTKIVKKSAEYTQESAPFIKYTIEVNTESVTLLDGTERLRAVDTIGSALKFVDADYFQRESDKNTYRVQVIDVANSRELTRNQDYTYDMSTDRHQISFSLPDGKHLRLIYWAYAYPNTRLTPANSTNSFKLSGMVSDALSDEHSFDMVAYTPNGWAGSEVGSIEIYKFWTDQGAQIALENSVFRLIKMKYDRTNNVLVPDGEGGTEILYDNIRITDENRSGSGRLKIDNLPVNQIMALYEIDADEGFAVKKEPYYFVLEGSTAVTVPEGFGITKYFSEQTIAYENVKGATLEIEKQVEGSALRGDIEGVITFTVTDESGTLIGTYQPGDPEFVYENGKWILELKDLMPGNYVVEETVCDATGHTAVSVVYAINAGSWSSTQKDAKDTRASVTLVENQTTKVTFKNVYEGFKIPVSKVSLVGGTPVSGAKLRITGTRTNGTAITPIEWISTDTAHEVELMPGTYVLEEILVPVGFIKADNMDITVSEDGTVMVDLAPATGVVMKDGVLSAVVSKVDADDHSVKVAGATIALYRAEDIETDGTPKAGSSPLDTWVSTADGTHDFGSVLQTNQSYVLVETNVPAGYEKADNIAFTVKADGQIQVTTPGVSVVDGVIYMEDMRTSVLRGSLKLTKTVAGGILNPGTLENVVKFRVQNADAATQAYDRTFTLGQEGFLWDATAGKYVLTIPNLPLGSYKVTEILGDSTPEGMTCSVSYTVDTTPVQNGDTESTGAVPVVAGGTRTVAFTNTYAYIQTVDTGSIVLEKKVAGVMSRTDLEGKLSFTIKRTDGGTPDYDQSFVLGSGDFTWDGSKYSLTIPNVPVGTYRVTESYVGDNSTPDNMSCTVTYLVNSTPGTGTIANDVSVPVGSSVTVTYTNTYAYRVGKLQVAKSFADAENALTWDDIKSDISFRIYDGNGTEVEESPIAGADLTQEGNLYKSAVLNLPIGTYQVKEVLTAQNEYTVTTTHTVTVDGVPGAEQTGKDTRSLTLGESSTIVVAYENVYERVPGNGRLILSKTVAGVLNRTELEGKIRFHVERTDGRTPEFDQSYILGEGNFTWQEAQEKYIQVIDPIPEGTYKVTEEFITESTPSNMTRRITYTATTSPAQNGEGSIVNDVIIAEDGEVTVAYTNTYEYITGKLKVAKSFTEASGTLAWDDIKDTLTFRIYDSNGTEIADSPIRGGDLTRVGDLYVSAAISLPIGTYRVKEETAAVSGYTLDGTSYTVDISAAAGGSGSGTATGDLALAKDKVITVTYQNTYSKDVVNPATGNLVITKSLKGSFDRSAAERTISFRVTNNDTQAASTYLLSDFTYNAATKLYTLELVPTEGGYTVEEIETTLEGYKLTRVTYAVNGAAARDGKTTTVTVPAGGTSKVAFTDTYKKIKTGSNDDDDDDDDGDDIKVVTVSTTPSVKASSLVRTGDETPLGILTALFVMGFAGLMTSLGVMLRRRRRG